jgi:hypothetical protein
MFYFKVIGFCKAQLGLLNAGTTIPFAIDNDIVNG